MTRFLECVALILRHEGGYVDHPEDPGGATNHGITLATLRAWRNDPDLTAEQVRALTREEAVEIYRSLYWNRIRAQNLPAGLDLALFDYAVNSGPPQAVRSLQGLLGVRRDGSVGPQTLAAIRAADPRALIRDLCAARLTLLRSLPGWGRFGVGWSRRVAETEAAALRAVGRPVMDLRTAATSTGSGQAGGVTALVGAVSTGVATATPFVEALKEQQTSVALALIGLIGLVYLTLLLRRRRQPE
jgi:lysozyme family protein